MGREVNGALLRTHAGRPHALNPARYTCYRATGPIVVDGKLDEPSWLAAPRSSPFVDIVTGEPAWFDTRVAMLWDDEHLYFGFAVEETDVGATLTFSGSPLTQQLTKGLNLEKGKAQFGVLRQIRVPDRNELARIAKRKRLQEHRVNQAEDGSVRPNAKRQRQYGDRRKPRRACECPNRVSQVLHEINSRTGLPTCSFVDRIPARPRESAVFHHRL
jgi:hypothetical protein